MASAALPVYVQTALAHPETERKTWAYGIGPNYIGLFLWVAFFDQLGGSLLGSVGLLPAVMGAAVGGLLAFALLYYGPAIAGLGARQPLAIVATGAFGVSGARWLVSLAMGLAHVVFFAIAVSYATDFTLRGLVSARLLSPRFVLPLTLAGRSFPSALFLVTAVVWSAASSLVALRFVRWVGAIMYVFPILPALVLGGVMLWSLAGLAAQPPPAPEVEAPPELRIQAFLVAIQFVCAFFATAGAASVDWGAASRDKRDVFLGGVVGIAFAVTIVAALALVTIFAARGRAAPALDHVDLATQQKPLAPSPGPVPTFGTVLQNGVGGPVGGAMLMVFGLGSMAPAVFAAFVFGRRLTEVVQRSRRLYLTLLGAAVGVVLIALRITARLDIVFGILGAVFAPITGIVSAEYFRLSRAWSGPRRGFNPAGAIAWVLGLVVGLLPLIGDANGNSVLTRVQPATVLAFVSAFFVHLVLSLCGLTSSVLPVNETTPGATTTAPAASEQPS
jgi:cytosine permease